MIGSNDVVLIAMMLGLLYVFVALIFMIIREPVLWALNFFKPALVFKTRLSMAERGYYKYEGLVGFAEIRGIPVARVLYPDNEKSVKMAMGNAVDYREIFGGTVIPA